MVVSDMTSIVSKDKQKLNKATLATAPVSIKIEKKTSHKKLTVGTCRSYDENREIPSFMRCWQSTNKVTN